jgi:ferritin
LVALTRGADFWSDTESKGDIAMLSEKMLEALNGQLNAEWYSSYLYVSMGAYFASLNLKGFAHWMEVQGKEEWVHGEMFYAQINARRGRVTLQAIAAPPTEWRSSQDVFQEVLAHEQKVTGLINKLVDQAVSESDHATNNFLQWFVAEQVEEEEAADEILQQLKLIGDNPQALLMLDRELTARAFSLPAAAVGTATALISGGAAA